MKLLVTGASGKLGRELIKVFPDSYHPVHEQLEITDRPRVFDFVKENLPEAIIHCAAITGIRECEENKELAWQVNVRGTENIVDACIKYNKFCYFIYVSTACVFNGDKGAYKESDLPQPKNFYSLTKLLSEFIVKRAELSKWLIIRTNFVAREKWPYPKAFVDRYGTYLFADDLAIAIKSVVDKQFTGILHVCGKEKLSMFDLAKVTTHDIKPMTLDEYIGPPLTRDMSLESERITAFNITK
ncbi:MAG: SDR family oxidoreductase [Candidatus Bathyarchaeota archaeon]|nr:SDR family oxidoreductase [Candidatus Bathyarchaeota archaeon]HGJ66026.1 SDR family oxidoreductase [bacterium]